MGLELFYGVKIRLERLAMFLILDTEVVESDVAHLADGYGDLLLLKDIRIGLEGRGLSLTKAKDDDQEGEQAGCLHWMIIAQKSEKPGFELVTELESWL